MNVTLGGVDYLNTLDTDGIAVAIFFQGCKRRCKGCHNPSLQPFEGGVVRDVREVFDPIKNSTRDYDAVAFIGGEPLEQLEALLEMLLIAKKEFGLSTWLYTGYDYEDIPEDIKEIVDVVVAGEYIEGLRTESFPASSNQRVIRREK